MSHLLAAVPSTDALRKVVVRALSAFLQCVVDRLVKLQAIYNGQGLRGDGNYKLASRIVVRHPGQRYPTRPYTVVPLRDFKNLNKKQTREMQTTINVYHDGIGLGGR